LSAQGGATLKAHPPPRSAHRADQLSISYSVCKAFKEKENMSRQKIFKLISLILILGLFLSACAPAATPAPEAVQTEAEVVEPAATEPPAEPLQQPSPSILRPPAAPGPPDPLLPKALPALRGYLPPSPTPGWSAGCRATDPEYIVASSTRSSGGTTMASGACTGREPEISPDGLTYIPPAPGCELPTTANRSPPMRLSSPERYKDETLSGATLAADNVEKSTTIPSR
jgi:hypothetical protein